MEIVSEITSWLYEHAKRYGAMPVRFPVSESTYAALLDWMETGLTHPPIINDEQAMLGYQNVFLRGVAIYPEREA